MAFTPPSSLASFSGPVAVTQSTSPWIVDGSAVTQPVSAVALPLPAGASTAARQDAQTALLGGGLPSALVGDRLKVDGSGVVQPVSGPLTDAELRASAVDVLGPLTDAELRATPVPVEATIEPPEGAATDDTLAQVLAEVAGSARLLAVLTSAAVETDVSDLIGESG
jgi:hypothetical protein